MGDVRVSEQSTHLFEQNADATQVRVCVCGKWPDHHVHTGNQAACGCDVCRGAQLLPDVEQTAVVRPGDTLIVRVRPNIPPEQLQRCADLLKERLPDVEVCLIGAEELAVYRPEKLHSVELAPPNVDELAKSVAERIGRQSQLRRRTG